MQKLKTNEKLHKESDKTLKNSVYNINIFFQHLTKKAMPCKPLRHAIIPPPRLGLGLGLTSGLLFDDLSHFVHVIDTHYVWAACAATWAELFKAGLR